MALLEADVNMKIVKSFVSSIRDQVLGSEVDSNLDPGKQFIKLVHEKLVEVMGKTPEDLAIENGRLNKILMVGLQGSGKTTTTGKLAKRYAKHKPLLVACDIYRPAAVQQLETVAKQVQAGFYEQGTDSDPVQIAMAGIERAKADGHQLVIVDTAGRLQIDDNLMGELERLKDEVKPQEILLVIDAMTGQEAVRVSQAFDQRLGLTGVILSKIDGDARGGAALSIRETIAKPIKFIGIGEKLDGLELFDPERMAQRILGMGDVMGLIEKASGVMDESKAKRMQRRMGSGQFNLVDFFRTIRDDEQNGSVRGVIEDDPWYGSV